MSMLTTIFASGVKMLVHNAIVTWAWAIVVAAVESGKYIRNYLRCVWFALRLPGPLATPLIGHAQWVADSNKFTNGAVTIFKEYGPIIRVWLTIFPVVIICEPLYIQKILSNTKHVEKNYVYKLLDSFFGPGLVSKESQVWKIHRRLMQPAFRPNVINGYVEVFSRGADSLIENLKIQVQLGKSKVNVVRFINNAVFSILIEVFLDKPVGGPESLKLQQESPYRGGAPTAIQRIFRPWLLIEACYGMTKTSRDEVNRNNSLIEYTKDLIVERRRILKETPTASKCMLDHLLEISDQNKDVFTSNDCVNEACTLMLAGQDTVAAAIAFTLYLLAKNQVEQEKAFQEQRVIFGDSNRSANVEDVGRMVYLERCIKEALRLYPSIPFFGRKLGEDLKVGKSTIPKGCDVMLSIFATHRLEQYYPNPEVFDPDRFDVEKSNERPLGSYIPFSLGSRNCIGYKFAELQTRTIVSTVIRQFHLQPVLGKEEVKLAYGISLRAHGGIWIQLTPRR